MTKKRIDIEKLVQWTLREELPKGRPVSTEIGQIIGKRFHRGGAGMLAGLLPRTEFDSLGFVPGAPHEDAERVGDAIAHLSRTEKLKVSDDAAAMFHPWSSLAETVIPTLRTGIFNPQAMVISKAIAGGRPRWEFEQPNAYCVTLEFRDEAGNLRDRKLVEGLDADGALVAMKPNRGRKAMRFGLYDLDAMPRSPLVWANPGLLEIGHARAEYLFWHRALVELCDNLAGELCEFEVVLPAARPAPWITGQVEPSKVLSDGKTYDGCPLPMAPKRKSAGPPIESDIEALTRVRAAEYRAVSRKKKNESKAQATGI